MIENWFERICIIIGAGTILILTLTVMVYGAGSINPLFLGVATLIAGTAWNDMRKREKAKKEENNKEGMLADAIMPKEEVAADPIGVAAPLAVTEDNLSPDEVWALSEEGQSLSEAFFEEKDWSEYDTPTFVRKGMAQVNVAEVMPAYALEDHSIIQDAVVVEEEAIYYIENEEERQHFFFDEIVEMQLQH